MQPIYFSLSDKGLLCVRGKKADALLQGQLTCNIQEITPTETRLGAHCNPQGRVISLFRVFYFNDAYYLLMPKTLLPIAMQGLQKYAPFFQVTLHDASDELFYVGYCSEQEPTLAIHQAHRDDNTLRIRVQSIATPRYLLISQTPIENPQQTALAWRQIELAEGTPELYPETTEKFLPHELNLPALNAVNFQKGCYTGQEIIARMHYRGTLKTRLFVATVTSDTSPLRGSALYPSGYIVDVTPLAPQQYQLLIIAQIADAKEDRLSIDTAGQLPIQLVAEKQSV